MVKQFSVPIEPNWQGFIDCISRSETPDRVYNIELYLDAENNDYVAREFDLLEELDEDDPHFRLAKYMRIQQFLGYDYVVCGQDDPDISLTHVFTADTADLARSGGRAYMEEHRARSPTGASSRPFLARPGKDDLPCPGVVSGASPRGDVHHRWSDGPFLRVAHLADGL